MKLPVVCVWYIFSITLFVCISSCKNKTDQKPVVSASVPDDTVSTYQPAGWVARSNVYEVNIRQYTREGTFNAFSEHLQRLKEMGVQIIWLMPVTPISKVDRKGTLGSYYAVQDYRTINPEFGTMTDFKNLVNKAHEQGLKIITDWVPNHTGADHRWLQTNTNFYHTDSTGKPRFAFDWSDTRELNYDNMAMRDSMTAAMKFWLTETGIDGFRIDVAGEVPTNFWQECIPQLRAIKEIFLLAEADKPELHAAGFDVTYPWEFFHTMKQIASGQRTIIALDSLLQRQDTTFPIHGYRLYFTSNHDENSWNKSDYGTFPGVKHAPFAVLTQTLPRSVPLIYSGQEEPVLRAISFFEKDNMNFRNYRRGKFYSTLLHLRNSNPALAADASFTRINAGDPNSIFGFIRENGNDKIAVILNLSGKAQKIIITDQKLTGEPLNVFMGVKEKLTMNHQFNLEPWGYLIYEYK